MSCIEIDGVRVYSDGALKRGQVEIVVMDRLGTMFEDAIKLSPDDISMYRYFVPKFFWDALCLVAKHANNAKEHVEKSLRIDMTNLGEPFVTLQSLQTALARFANDVRTRS